jgi:hypothetical protein
MSAIYNSTMSYSSKSYLDTLGSISLLNSMQISGPTPTTTATTTLDVNNTNLSVSAMLNLLDSFNANQLNSYDTATLVEPNPNLTITNKNIVLFSTPLSSSFQKSDIKYHTSTSTTFLGGNSPSLSDESFQKINTLVNEIFLMKPELTTYRQAQTKFPIFTFTEILRDTDGVNSYLCSIRVIFYNAAFYTQDLTFPNALYFVISHLNVNNMVKLPSFNNVLGQISSTKRLMNFSYIVLRNFLNTAQTFSDYIANSNFKNRFGGSGIYIFYYKLNNDAYTNVLKPYNELTSYDTIFLHEQNPQWAGVDSKNLFASENDLIVSQATYNIYKSLMNYFEFRKDMQFGVNYKWNYGQKHSSCMLFDITANGATTTYMIGCGVNLETFIPISIKSTGDTLLSGDFNIKDINDNSIFQISNSEKKVTSAYKVGVGKDQPQTTMDIEDTSMASILDVIDKMSNTVLFIDKNKKRLSEADLSTKNFIEIAISKLDDTKGNLIIQNKFFYASIYKINNDYNVGNQTVVYNWLFGNSDNKIWNISNSTPSTTLPKKLSELPSSKQLDFLSSYMLGLLTTKFIIPDTTVSNIYNWVYGKKLAFTSFFKNTNTNTNDSSSVYCFVLGIDLQQYNLRYNTNDNIEKLFLCIDTYQSLLQVIIKGIPTYTSGSESGLPLPHYIQATEKLKNNLSLYGNPTAISKYTIYPSSSSVQSATGFDYTKNTGTLKLTTDLFNSPLTYTPSVNITSDNISDANLFIMYQSLINRINSQYPFLSSGENGIVWFEDSKEYYVSIFYCISSTALTKTIISIEFPLDTFIMPTVIVKGDTRVNGELSTRVLNQPSNFTTIDPDRNFVGFGTDERELYYSYLTPNTKSPFFYVSNANKDINYPCAVFDRSDVNDSSLISTIVNVKRTLKTTGPVGAGLDIGFEITKNNGQTQRLGSIGMTIEDSNLNSGFFVKKFGATTNLMSISNSGQLSVDSILLTAIPSPPSTIVNGTLTINLGTSMFGSQTIVLTSNVTNIDYINGLENGTYTIKINLNSKTIAYVNYQTIFNATTNTNNSATVLLVKVNTFKNGNNMQYFTNMTYYAAA